MGSLEPSARRQVASCSLALLAMCVGCGRTSSGQGSTSSSATATGSGPTAQSGAIQPPSVPKVARVALGKLEECMVFGDGRARCSPYAGGKALDAMRTEIGGPTDVVDIGMGTGFACLLGRKADVWCWGQGALEFVGPAGVAGPKNPTQIGGLGEVLQLAVGPEHVCVLAKDGAVWCWGHNGAGQLANDDVQVSSTPTRVAGLPAVEELAVGALGGCGRAGQKVYCWGGDKLLAVERRAPAEIGALADAASIAVGPWNLCASSTSGTVTCTAVEQEQLTSFPIEAVSNAVSIAMGQAHGCARTNGGEVWCWGATDELLTGGFRKANASAVHVDGLTKATQLAAHGALSCAVTEAGSLWCWKWGPRKAGEPLRASAEIGGN